MIWFIVWVYWEGEQRSRPWSTYDNEIKAESEVRRLRRVCHDLQCGYISVSVSDLPTMRAEDVEGKAVPNRTTRPAGRGKRQRAAGKAKGRKARP